MKYKNLSITLRKDNRFQTKIGNTTIYGKTKEECYNKYLDFISTDKTNYTFKEWSIKWFNAYKTTNKNTSNERIKSILKNYAYVFEQKKISDIKPLILIEQINNVYNEGHKRQAQYIYTIYNDIFDKAVKNGIIDKNPMLAMQKPKYKSEEKNALSLNDEKLFLNLIENTKYNYVLKFCLFQGTRIGEALALNYYDIDFFNKKINISKSRNAKNIVDTPKTEKSKRTIPLFDNTIELLNLIDINKNEKFVFDFSYDEIQKFLKKISMNFNYQLTSHCLRHTFATRCIEKGINIKLVSKWLGHSNITITNTIYTHINDDFESKEIDILNHKL